MGGYWVHLSEDGGVSWQELLYTGLSEFFPYAVRPKSALLLRDGDLINLEVSIRLIDTASITYPPVALRPRKEQDGLYLEIPLSELRKDSDGDGVTDISEAHLLLDREGADAPAILGHIEGVDCSEPPTREKLARVAVLRALFKIESSPIIEPLGRSTDSPLSFGDWRTSETGEGAPLFLKGDSQDFACLSTDRLAIIYDEQHIEELQRRTPHHVRWFCDCRLLAMKAEIADAFKPRTLWKLTTQFRPIDYIFKHILREWHLLHPTQGVFGSG